MPALSRETHRIVIAGASSLLGVELKSLLEESRFASSDFRLLDEAVVAGTLTGAGGEPAVILPVEEGSFDRARKVFFTGSPEFTRTNLPAAQGKNVAIIDLSGGIAGRANTVAWFPKLDWLRGREFPKKSAAYVIPSAAATACAALALALSKVGLRHLSLLCFQPVSEASRAGIEELESQTGQLLSLHGVGQPIFDTQVAFNLLDRFGPASAQKLNLVRDRLRLEAQASLGDKTPMPAIQLVHAPVFYGTAFSACAQLDPATALERIVEACKDAGFIVAEDGDPSPSNVSVAGEKNIHVAKPEADPSAEGAWWLWGAADNIRLPAANAVKLAEMLS